MIRRKGASTYGELSTTFAHTRRLERVLLHFNAQITIHAPDRRRQEREVYLAGGVRDSLDGLSSAGEGDERPLRASLGGDEGPRTGRRWRAGA